MRDRLLQAAAKLSTISVAQYSTKKSLNEESSLKGSAISTNLPLATNGAAKVTDSNTITCSVPVGDKGIGLVLTTKTFGSTDALVIKGFHEIANTSQNPCQAAGLKVGDRIVLINNTAAVSTSDAVSLIKGAKGTISFTVQR